MPPRRSGSVVEQERYGQKVEEEYVGGEDHGRFVSLPYLGLPQWELHGEAENLENFASKV